MDGTDLMDVEPGSDVGVGPDAARPWPTDTPGDTSGGWLKVGAGNQGGSEFAYTDGLGGPAPWKQT